MKRFCASLVLIALLNPHYLWAQVGIPQNVQPRSGSEYFSGKEYGKPLITIRLISGVTNPGVYHVPVGTNLADVLAFAGGTNNNADISDVKIRRYGLGMKFDTVKLDIEEIMEASKPFPVVQNNDVIVIKEDQGISEASQWVALIGGIFSIVMSIFLVRETLRDEANGR